MTDELENHIDELQAILDARPTALDDPICLRCEMTWQPCEKHGVRPSGAYGAYQFLPTFAYRGRDRPDPAP